MSEEDAFLAALKANPVDDITRLAYADWLENQGEPEKAEYLRLSTRLPCDGDDVDTTSAKATRVNDLGASFPVEWKEAAAGRFEVVLLDFADAATGGKRVQGLFGIYPDDAQAVVETAPIRLLVRTSFDSALSYYSQLSDSTGLTLAIRPSDRHGTPKAVMFHVCAGCTRKDANGPQNFGRDWELDMAAVEALAQTVSAALEIGIDQARRWVTNPRFLLAPALPFIAARERRDKYQQFCIREEFFETDCFLEIEIRDVP